MKETRGCAKEEYEAVFDPTAFDNWKVVVEGALYDLDREGQLIIIGREDLVDLAKMSRKFQIRVRESESSSQAELQLVSSMADFVGERHEISLSDNDPPGIRMNWVLTLPGERLKDAQELHKRLESVWHAEAEIRHSVRVNIDPRNPPHTASEQDSEYIILITFRNKWSEDKLERCDALLDRLLSTLAMIR
jgi:hypothetical protein